MRKETSGQVLLPGLAAILILIALFGVYMTWAKHALQQMRMDLVADATALSAARSQAEMLNYIAAANLGVNRFIQKANVPLVKDAVGVMQEKDWPDYESWHSKFLRLISGFKTVPSAVGEVVSRLNGSQGYAPYFPFPMPHYLKGQGIHVGIPTPHAPFIIYHHFDNAYFAREWSPSKTKAQPPHKTTWVVTRDGIRSIATARLWLDVKPGSVLNNGGFPRPQEKWLRGAFIQCSYPQFNARLMATPAISMDKLLDASKRKGP